jgi:hypothetical protein
MSLISLCFALFHLVLFVCFEWFCCRRRMRNGGAECTFWFKARSRGVGMMVLVSFDVGI